MDIKEIHCICFVRLGGWVYCCMHDIKQNFCILNAAIYEEFYNYTKFTRVAFAFMISN